MAIYCRKSWCVKHRANRGSEMKLMTLVDNDILPGTTEPSLANTFKLKLA